MDNWLFWLMLIMIILLFTFILIRDERVRTFVKRIFSWISKKIRVAKMKSKIGKEEGKKRNKQKELGQKAFMEKLDCAGADNCNNEISDFKNREENLKADIAEIENKLKTLNHNFNLFEKEQNEMLEKLIKELDPIKEKQRQDERALSDLEREKRDKTGIILKNDKKIKADNDKIARINEDMSTSHREKEEKESDIKEKIKELKDENAKCQNRMEIIDIKLKELQKAAGQENPRIADLQQQIDRVKEKIKNQKSELDKKYRELEINKKTANDIMTDLNKKIDLKYEELGRIFDDKRVDHPLINNIYVEIDKINHTLAKLSSQLKTEKNTET